MSSKSEATIESQTNPNASRPPESNGKRDAALHNAAGRAIRPAAAGSTGTATTQAGPGLPEVYTDERDDVLAVITELEDQLDADEQVRAVIERELAEARAARQRLEHTVRNAEEKIHELQRANDSLTEKVDTIRTEKKALQAQVLLIERENGKLTEQRQNYESELAALRNMNHSSEAALASIRKAFGEVRVALAETKTRTRRRTTESWPRSGGALRGIATGAATDHDSGRGIGIEEAVIGSNEYDFANVAPTPTYGQSAGPTPAGV